MNSKRLAIAVMGTAFASTMVSAHLPSANDASLQFGRQGNFEMNMGRSARNVSESDFSNHGAWDASKTYKGSYAIGFGDTVSHGEWNGKKLWWWAKFAADGTHTPGEFAPNGGTSPWILINSISAQANGTPTFEWKGWNGQLEQSMGNGLAAEVPTWRDGAEGAYSFTHDDIGAIPFDVGVQPAWDLADDYPDIRQGWGIYVEQMSSDEWEKATAMVRDGYEMFNHSMDHSTSAEGWQWFYPNKPVPTHDPAIPIQIRGLTVEGVWKVRLENAASFLDGTKHASTGSHEFDFSSPQSIDTADGGKTTDGSKSGPATGSNPVAPHVIGLTKEWENDDNATAVFYNDYVEITAPVYWDGLSPESDMPVTVKIIDPSIEKITIPGTNQELYVKYTKKDFSEGDDKYATVENEGVLIASASGWYDLGPLLTDYTNWYNGYFVKKTEYNTAGGQLTYIDQGRPGFVAKVQTSIGWSDAEYKLNMKDANDSINTNIYEKIGSTGEFFRQGKRSEYYGYPLDIYSEDTHKKLVGFDIPAARGGAKSGKPMPGDFFHPYRIDFDAFMIVKKAWTADSKGEGWVYPDNPHVLLGLNEMADKIIENNGYMIREFHSVATSAMNDSWHNGDDSDYNSWDVNSSGAGLGGWWGGITQGQLIEHYNYLQGLIDARKLVVYTPSEAVKYRITANSVSGATVVPANEANNYTLTVATSEDPGAMYHEEISVLVSFPSAVKSVGITYNTVDAAWGEKPRRAPRRMNGSAENGGTVWSVSVNPFLGAANVVGNGTFVVGIENGITTAAVAKAAFSGINNGRVQLSLPAGNFTAQLFNAQGRIVGQADVISNNGLVNTNLSTSNLGTGIYYLNVTANGAQVMSASKIMIQ